MDFASIAATPPKIAGLPSLLTGQLTVNIVDASFTPTLSPSRSRYTLTGFEQKVNANVAQGATTRVGDLDGVKARSYGADVSSVTIATGGHSPALASWLRRRFEAEFGPEYDDLLELLSVERERLRSEGRSTEGLPWQDALDSGLLELLRSKRTAEALELLRSCLSSSSA